MVTRKAHARWEGSIKEGKGEVDFGNGKFKEDYSFASRFEQGSGTNPEELLGAAHASCFAMALTLGLEKAGFKPNFIDAKAHVTIVSQNGGFKISESHLVCEGDVSEIDEKTFLKHVDVAKAHCPVSQALTGVKITVEAELVKR